MPGYRRVHGPNHLSDESNSNDSDQRVPALSRLPKTLHALWQEYEFGSPGKKPARDFTPAERGKVKHTYYMRKFLWNTVAEMVRSGIDANVACDKIYEVYGQNQSVTKILNALKRDIHDRGGHPSLRLHNV